MAARHGLLNSERALHRLHAVALDHVADPHILVILKRHTAFLADDHFPGIILEALELRQLTLVNHHIVANEAHVGAALDRSLGDPAAGNLAHFGDIEDLQDKGSAEHRFAQYRRQQAGHCFFHVIDEIVDDIVVTNFHAIALGHFARFLVGAHVEADDRGARGLRKRDVGFADTAGARQDYPGAHLLGPELFKRARNGFDRTLHIALDEERELLASGGLELTHHLFERSALAARPRRDLFALLTGTVVGHLAGTRFAVDDGQAVAGFRRSVEAKNLHRRGRAGVAHGHAGIRQQGPHATPFGAGDYDIAAAKRAALHQHGRHRAATTVKLGLDYSAFGRPG